MRSPVYRFLAGILLTASATGVLEGLRGWLNTSTVALVYVLAVGATTAWWGLIPGLGAALLSFLLFNYLFIPPYLTLRVLHPQDVIELIVLLVVAIVISQLLGRAQTETSHAQAHERETQRLYELSTSFIGQTDFANIARTIARGAMEAFAASSVTVVVVGEGAEPLAEVAEPGLGALPPDPPAVTQEILGSQGHLGEIRLWRAERDLSASEARLLRAFATAAALALERARLAQSETRARVLEQSDALKSALLSSVSHDLRTPLATILASVTSLASREIDWDAEARRELLATIEEESEQLNFLVGNLLDMSRIEAGSLSPRRRSNSLAEIAGGAITRMEKTLGEHRVVCEVSEDLPSADVDYVQIEQVFANLLSNSAKYSPPGTAIRIGASVQDEGWLLVRLENEGQPIAEDHLERIFEKFHRIYPDERITGTGLGLSICKGIVEAHGGRIWARNAGGGVAFYFTLPRAPAPPELAGTA
jgi:two-component system sensor histidine kinase KdpD